MPVVGQASVRIVADARGFARDVEQAVNRELRNVDPAPGARAMAQKTETTLKKETRRGFGEVAEVGLRAFGTTLQGGISPATAGTFGLVVLAALLPVMTIVGSALAGALVLAFGTGIAGIGLFAAAQSERVQNEFANAAKAITSAFRREAKPLESALVTIAGIFEDTLLELAPTFGDAFQELSPALVEFSQAMADALLALEPAIGPVTDAFIDLLDELGPALAEEVFPDLADAIINLAAAVSENADTVTDIITWFLQAVEATINFISELTRLAGWFAEQSPVIRAAIGVLGATIVTILGAVLGPIAAVVAAIIGFGVVFLAFKDDIIGGLQIIWEAFVDIFGAIGEFLKEAFIGLLLGVETFVDNAINTWDEFTEGIGNGVDAIIGFFESFGGFLTDVYNDARQIWGAMERAFNDTVNDIEDGINSVIDFFTGLPGSLTSAVAGMWDPIWQSFRSTVNEIIGAWNGLSFTIPSASFFGQTIGGGTISTPNIPYLQDGGIIRSGGSVVVGEAGPELLSLPQGARVDPLSGGGGGQAPVDVRVFIGDRELTDIVDVQIDERNTTLRRRVTSGAGQARTGVLAA